jgi:hypothetical protein
VRTILFQEICKCAIFPDRFLTNLAMNAPRRFGSHGHVASPHLLLKDGKSPRSIKQARRLPQKPLNLGLRDQRAPQDQTSQENHSVFQDLATLPPIKLASKNQKLAARSLPY